MDSFGGNEGSTEGFSKLFHSRRSARFALNDKPTSHLTASSPLASGSLRVMPRRLLQGESEELNKKERIEMKKKHNNVDEKPSSSKRGRPLRAKNKNNTVSLVT